MHTLFLYHDPMCSWCWAYRPTSDELADTLPVNVQLRKILGGLAPDSNEPMPEGMRRSVSDTWRQIQAMLGTPFNFDFWEVCSPRRSTYPACRAVIAAARQGAGDKMIDAIQRAYYLRAMNPSDQITLEQLARELSLDAERFAADLSSTETEDELQVQIAFTRRSRVRGFPSLVLQTGEALVPVLLDHKSSTGTLDHINSLLGR